MKRRSFITLLGGAAATWPMVARGQQPGIRRIGLLLNFGEDDKEGEIRIAAFRQSLSDLGWIEGGNLKVEYRWSPGEAERTRLYVTDLMGLKLDVIVTSANAAVVALRRLTQAPPVIFTIAADPVASGFVASMARPGGNMTGFTQFEAEIGGKWLETLKEVAPRVKRVLVLVSPENTISPMMVRRIEASGPTFGVEVRSAGEPDAAGIERALNAFARDPDGGLIVPPNAPAVVHRELIVALTAKLGLPAIYASSSFVRAGGLIAYGVDTVDVFRRTAGYVDRILRGEKPGDLPVQAPTKLLMSINLKAARELGIVVPPSVLVRADEVIE